MQFLWNRWKASRSPLIPHTVYIFLAITINFTVLFADDEYDLEDFADLSPEIKTDPCEISRELTKDVCKCGLALDLKSAKIGDCSNDAEIKCACDCTYIHAATGSSNACYKHKGEEIPCHCKYIREMYTDFAYFDGLRISTPTTRNVSQERKDTKSEQKGIDPFLKANCRDVLRNIAAPPVCEDVVYQGKTFDAETVCAIDCVCNHGAELEPYGVCISSRRNS